MRRALSSPQLIHAPCVLCKQVPARTLIPAPEPAKESEEEDNGSIENEEVRLRKTHRDHHAHA
jgi:hypothetical protein